MSGVKGKVMESQGSEKIMIIDIHTHVEFKNLEERYSPEEFVAGMDEGGIDREIESSRN